MAGPWPPPARPDPHAGSCWPVWPGSCWPGAGWCPGGGRPGGDPGIGAGFGEPEVVASGLEAPWGLAFLPDGDALVSERDSGRILQVGPGTEPRVVGTVPGVDAGGEGGLLGLAVSPEFASDRLVYAYFSAQGDNRIVRFRLGGGQVEVLLEGIPSRIHNGGRIAFGPDGMLYAGTGDAAERGNAQDPGSLGGKILRLRPDGGIPADNPDRGRRSGPSGTATCRGWPGTTRDGCSPPSSARTGSTRSTGSSGAATTAGRRSRGPGRGTVPRPAGDLANLAGLAQRGRHRRRHPVRGRPAGRAAVDGAPGRRRRDRHPGGRAGRVLRPAAPRRRRRRRRPLGPDQQPRRPRRPAPDDDRVLRFPRA